MLSCIIFKQMLFRHHFNWDTVYCTIHNKKNVAATDRSAISVSSLALLTNTDEI